MPTVEITPEQVIELVKQLPLQTKLAVLKALNQERKAWWDEMLTQGEQQFRKVCAERGLNWDQMTEDAREAFIDDLVHEDR